MSQGGIWTQGGAVGLDWQNVQTTGGSPGCAYGTGTSASTPVVLYNDNIATLQNSGISTTKHYAQMTVRNDAGYTPAAAHELELLCGFTISAHSAAGYEMDFELTLTPVRWNGAAGDFVTNVFTTLSGATFTPADGDVVKVVYDSTSGSPVFTLYLNGVQQWQFTDTTAGKITSGYPGQGHFYRDPVSPTDFPKRSIKGYSAGSA